MFVDQEQCIGCKRCVVYCPLGAIHVDGRKAHIDEDVCVECANCKRANVCKSNALCENELAWPRQVRSQMSNVKTEYKGVNGRGTEEMKTNDVTHRFSKGHSGIAIELGRPGVSTAIRDLERIAMAVAGCGVQFEDLNPITSYIIDKKTGKFSPEILDERALSGIIELSVPDEKLLEVVRAVLKAAEDIETVFSLDLVCIVDEDGTIAAQKLLDDAGIYYRPNGKTNVGLGRAGA